MAKLEMEHWRQRVAAYIKYRPDRFKVELELAAHMEDKYEALREAGLSEYDSVRETVRSMGDADEIGRALAKQHKPYLGYIYSASVWLLCLAILVAICAAFGFPGRLGIITNNDAIYEEVYTQAATENGVRTLYIEPDCSASSDGYTFTVTQAVQWHYDFTDAYGMRFTGDSFYFTIRAINPLPWAGPPYGVTWFTAEDSLGNQYVSYDERESVDESCVTGNLLDRRLFSYTYDMWLSNYTAGAEWIELRYERSGREIVLRIDLEGENAE